MVCILCDSKTKTTNSRYRSSLRQTWRRHTCNRCQAVYTTREIVDLEQSYRVIDQDGQMQPLSRDELFLSIYDCMRHRSNAITESAALTTTVIAKLINQHMLRIPVVSIIDETHQTLRRFNRGVATIYATKHCA